MGDEILMKKMIFLTVFFTLCLNANTNQKQIKIVNKEELVKEYKNMFEEISKKRVGLDESEIENVKQPFLTIRKKTKGKKSNQKKMNLLTLEAILNKKVLINGTWYSLYQKINNKKIIKITDNSVWLKSEAGIEKLTIRNKNANISIK